MKLRMKYAHSNLRNISFRLPMGEFPTDNVNILFFLIEWKIIASNSEQFVLKITKFEY